MAIQEAIALIDAEGLEGFSIRRLARELGVQAPSLHYHFSDRRALMTEITTAIIRESQVPPFEADQPWTEWFVAMCRNVRKTVLRHRNAAPLLTQYLPRGTLTEWYETSAAFLAERGVPLHEQIFILDSLERVTLGASAIEATRDPATRIRLFPDFDSRTYPALRRAVNANLRSPEQAFEDTVRAFLDGVAAHLEAAQEA